MKKNVLKQDEKEYKEVVKLFKKAEKAAENFILKNMKIDRQLRIECNT